MDQTIYESATTLVTRCQYNGQPAIAKSLKAEARSPSAIARYQREFDLSQSLTSPFICQALAYVEEHHRIIFEDPGGVCLRDYLRDEEPAFDTLLKIARDLAHAVQSLHDEGVIHRDLNPGNVIVLTDQLDLDADDDKQTCVRVIDFGLATLMPRAYPSDPSFSLTGTLPYISPEQTGRVNRVIDYRTDLYSLGATFYEIFAAQPPFNQTDPLELIHAHIASLPPKLIDTSPNVPEWLSDLVNKLLAKQPETRYQSAYSVADDIAQAMQSANVVPFQLGRTDAVEQLVLPKKLYGRSKSQALLTDLLERTKQGETLFACVVGGHGMGKTALAESTLRQAQELKVFTARVNASTIDWVDTDTLWIELLRPVIRQVLSMPGASSEQIITRLQTNKSAHLASLCTYIPELSHILDPAPNAPGLPRKGISEVLDALRPHNLALVVEDAQSLPAECLETYTEISLEHRSILSLLLCEELNPILEQDPRLSTKTVVIELHLLDKADVRELLSDMLGHSEAKVRELAGEIQEKTDGVPALVHELIFELHQAGHLFWDRAHSTWAWQIDDVRRYFFNSNSNERIARLIDNLPAESRAPLCAGACIGESFELNLVAAALDRKAAGIAKNIRSAINTGVLAMHTEGSGTRYQFSHPRVRANLYERTPFADKARLHAAIAQSLAASPGQFHDNSSASIAHHLNAATDPISADGATRLQVAHRNLLAAMDSLDHGSFQHAFKFARHGLLLLRDQTTQALFTQLSECAAQAAYLVGDFDQLRRIIHTAPDSSALNEIQVRAAIAQNKLREAATLCEIGLAQSPNRYQRRSTWQFMARINPLLEAAPWNKQLNTNLKLPLTKLNDARLTQDARLIGYLAHARLHLGEIQNVGLEPIIISAVQGKGYSGEVALAYANAATQARVGGLDQRAKQMAKRARVIAEQFPDNAFSMRALTMVNGLVDPWYGNYDLTVRNLAEIGPRSLALNDFEFAACAGAMYATNGLLRGLELGSLKRTVSDQLEHVTHFGLVTGVNIQYFVLQIIASLLAQPLEHSDLSEQARVVYPDDDVFAQANVYTLRLYFAVLFQDFAGAAGVADTAAGFEYALRPSPLHSLYLMCHGLVSARTGNIKALKRQIRELSRIVNRGTTIAQPKLYILLAELACVRQMQGKSLELWEQAAESARRHGLANDEALAYELAARACEERGRVDFTKLFARNAYQSYLRWGAVAKANQLEREFPDVKTSGHDVNQNRPLGMTDITDLTVRDFQTHHNSANTSEFSDRVLDTTTVLKAAQTISGEIVLDRVLSKLLRLALEHAGAQKAVMLLQSEGRMFVEAISGVDGGTTRRMTPPEPLEASEDVPVSIIQFVARTGKSLVLADATQEDVFTQDRYVQRMQPLSVMCLPIVQRNEVTGVLYVEHRWLTGVFTAQRVEVLALLASQAAISIENARLYSDLQSARDEYRTLYDSAIEGLFRISGEGQLLSANPTLASILGFEHVTSLLEEYKDLIHRVFLQTEQAQLFLSELEEKGQVTGFEAQGTTFGGRVFWMSLTARISRDADAQDYIDGSLIDISERIEREQAQKERQIAEAATQAKSEFLANMSHEIRTPMNAIVGFSKLTLDTQLDRKQHEYLTSIRNAGENLLNLVSDVLDFSKIEAGKLELEVRPFRLAETIRDVERLFRTEMRRKGLEFRVTNNAIEHPDFPASGMLLGDSLRLQQVLVNLIGNALKFTAEGTVGISVDVEAINNPSIMLRFTVRDTGIGISEEQIGRLFRSFEQAESSTTRRYGGTGLGLTICKRLVEVMGGDIDVSSEVEVGSEFAFTIRARIPSAAEVEAHTLPAQRFSASSLLRGRYILVAEDNPINQQLALEFLQRAGATVDIAETGRQAIAAAVDKSYDAILMDIHMPQTDGLEATATLRAEGIETPIIAVSADALSERKAAAMAAGCNGYVTKPIDFDLLLATLEPYLPAISAEAPPSGRRATDPTSAESAASEFDLSKLGFDLNRVPGIDLGEAIKNHNGNVKLMTKLMGDFGHYYSDAGIKIREYISQREFEEAERLAHNLHGVAGSFGAQRLKEASKTLELALAKGNQTNLFGLAQSFEIALAEVLDSAEALASNEIRFRASDFDAAERARNK